MGARVEVEDDEVENGTGARTTGWPFKTVVAPHPDLKVASSGPA